MYSTKAWHNSSLDSDGSPLHLLPTQVWEDQLKTKGRGTVEKTYTVKYYFADPTWHERNSTPGTSMKRSSGAIVQSGAPQPASASTSPSPPR